MMTDKAEKARSFLNNVVSRLAEESVRLKKEIDTAKTKVKKDYFMKKLKANNETLAKYLKIIDTVGETNE